MGKMTPIVVASVIFFLGVCLGSVICRDYFIEKLDLTKKNIEDSVRRDISEEFYVGHLQLHTIFLSQISLLAECLREAEKKEDFDSVFYEYISFLEVEIKKIQELLEFKRFEEAKKRLKG